MSSTRRYFTSQSAFGEALGKLQEAQADEAAVTIRIGDNTYSGWIVSLVLAEASGVPYVGLTLLKYPGRGRMYKL